MSSNLNTSDKYNVSSIFFVNLSGYGYSDGKPSQSNFYSDGLASFDYISRKYKISPDHIIVMARSLGSATAIFVASQRKISKLIAVTPFDSILNLIPGALKVIFPLNVLIKNKFDNIKRVKQVETPILIIEASNDKVIPHRNVMNLLNHCNKQTSIITIDKSDHQNISSRNEYYQVINDFLKQ